MDGIQELVNVLQTNNYEPSKTYSAEVSSIDNEGTVWVYLEGSNKETPTALSSAEVNVGDSVNVEWRNNKLYIAGNVSNPSAGVVRVNAVEQAAQAANQAAQDAITDAGRAHEAADQAQADATRAQGSADDAQKSADSAQNSANQAFREMSYVENIVGVLELVAKNGDYELTEDTEVQENKWYFTRSGTDPDYEYSVVANPEGNPQTQGWYELVDISDSIRNYVSSHLVLLNDGLWLRPDTGATQIHISTVTGNEGVIIYGADDKILAKYGSTAIIGDPNGFHLEIGEIVGGVPEVGFYLGSSKVAYLNSEELYVKNSLSFGGENSRFAFMQRPNGHFTLKLID